MSRFVLDCSVTMAWCFADEARPETDLLLDRARDDGAIVPALWFWEVANVLHGAVRRRRLTASDVAVRLGLLAALPIAVDEHGTARAWRETLLLAQTHALTVYDAAYLEVAIRLGADLASSDADLCAAARLAGVRVSP